MASSRQRTCVPDLSGLTITVYGRRDGHDSHEGSRAPRNWHERTRGAPAVVSTALAMAEGTAGVESASGAEKATAAKSEALEPGAYGEAGSR